MYGAASADTSADGPSTTNGKKRRILATNVDVTAVICLFAAAVPCVRGRTETTDDLGVLVGKAATIHGLIGACAAHVHRVAALFAVALAVALPSTAQRVHAEDLRLVIDRLPEAIEIYVALGADDADDIFALPESALTDPTGVVIYDELRQGTAPIADQMLIPVRSELGGQPLAFEAMSMMVHPVSDPLPLETPFDGLLSILVCTAPTPAVPPTLEELRLYAGYIDYVDNSDAPFSFTLPDTVNRPLEIAVREYRAGVYLQSFTSVVQPGGTITVFPGEPNTAPTTAGYLLVASALLALIGLALLVYPRLSGARRDPLDATNA